LIYKRMVQIKLPRFVTVLQVIFLLGNESK
jgi:hypothetical protein